MRRLFAIAASVAILLALFAPAALAAEPVTADGSVIVSVNGSVDVPAGQHLDAVVVIDGSARIGGTVDTVVVAGGTATLAGATVEDRRGGGRHCRSRSGDDRARRRAHAVVAR